MLATGRLCIKIAGRDAGQKCVIVSVIDNNYVLIDGNTRRRRCSITHLEPLTETIDLPENAPHEQVVEEFKKRSIFKEQKRVKRTPKQQGTDSTKKADKTAVPKKAAAKKPTIEAK